jgi:hypothetical protein
MWMEQYPWRHIEGSDGVCDGISDNGVTEAMMHAAL